MSKRNRTLAIAALAVGALVTVAVPALILSCEWGGKSGATKGVVRYHCPMHPTYISDRPGDCPICGMKLVEMEPEPPEAGPGAASGGEGVRPDSPAGAAEKPARAAARWHCPMHPTYISDKPGDCPICGMRLVPLEETPEEAGAEHAAHGGQAAPPSPAGYTGVKISAERLQVMGVTTTPVRMIDIERTTRAVGRVEFDETRLHHVHVKFEGYIEELHADSIGKLVQKGDPLLGIYSPELLATQEEYLLALRAKKRLQESTLPGVATGGADLLDAARQRLLLWDISKEEIARIEREGRPIKTILLRSSVGGYIVEKMVYQGMRVMPEDTLYDIADLSNAWVLADIYEYEVPFVKAGQRAEMTLAYLPGQTWEGKLTYVYPTLDERTRTVKVRLEFANPGMLLKPGMYADVMLKGDLGQALAVPESAVIVTGERKVVFVAKGEGRFEPREIETGTRVRDSIEVRSGLEEGEIVATGANFLLDSESRLKAAIAGMAGGHQHGQ